MGIIDAIIILFILLGAVIGFRRGFTKQLVSSLGFFLIVILAFYLKNPISVFLYEHLPFFKFAGVIKGVTVLNIAVYEFIAFFIVVSILTIIFKILLFATSIFEKILKFTIILGIPSKILGAIVGVIEHFVWVFIALYILNLPFLNSNLVRDSKLASGILKNTPILSGIISDSVKVVDEFVLLKEKYENTDSTNEFNKETLDLFLKYDIVKVESIDYLVEKKKIQIKGIDSILNKYRNEE